MASTEFLPFIHDEQELIELSKNPIDGCTIELINDDILNWRVTIEGPKSTPYANGLFNLSITFTDQYPFKPPVIKFMTIIHHPNVKKSTGEICGAIISDNWGPTLNVKHCITVMKSILQAPDTDNPFDEEIAAQMRDRPKEFEKAAIKCTKENALY